MTYQIVDTTAWDFDRLAPYGKAVTAAMHKLVERFTDDVTVPWLAEEVMTGRRKLWLVLEEDGAFVSFFMSQFRHLEATGKTLAVVTTLAGKEGLEAVPEIAEVFIPWAKEQGADLVQVEGRKAWHRELKKLGFEEYATIWRLDVKEPT